MAEYKTGTLTNTLSVADGGRGGSFILGYRVIDFCIWNHGKGKT